MIRHGLFTTMLGGGFKKFVFLFTDKAYEKTPGMLLMFERLFLDSDAAVAQKGNS